MFLQDHVTWTPTDDLYVLRGHLWPMTNSTIQIQWSEDKKAGEPNCTASSKNKNCILFNKTSFAYPLQGIYHERTKEWFNPLLISAPNWLDAASCVSFYLHIPSCPFLVQIISRFLVQFRVVEYFQDAHFTFFFRSRLLVITPISIWIYMQLERTCHTFQHSMHVYQLSIMYILAIQLKEYKAVTLKQSLLHCRSTTHQYISTTRQLCPPYPCDSIERWVLTALIKLFLWSRKLISAVSPVLCILYM
jgi:hypothetical protein